MPANIAHTMGRYNAMYVGYPAWHRLGEVVSEAKTPEEAMEIAGTNFTVAPADVYAKIGDEYHLYPGSRINYRTDNNALLGITSDEYPIIQNLTPMQMLNEIVRTSQAGIVAHAALGKGERLFAVLDLTRLADLQIPHDPSKHDAFLVAQWWHDGTGALAFGESLVRVDCQNMANAQLAYAQRVGRLARIVHRGNTTDAVEEAQRILGYAERHILTFTELLKDLVEIPIINAGWIDDFTAKLDPIPPEMERPASREEARDTIAYLYKESPTLAGVPNSPYRAFQAVTEYADHYRPLRVADAELVPARRFTTAMDGPAADLKSNAMRLLKEEFEIHHG